jgi:protein TonB
VTSTAKTETAYLRGWAASFLAHGLAVGMALVLFADLKLVPDKEPFRWTVSEILTPPPEPKPTESPAKPAPVPPTPTRKIAQATPPQPAPQVTEVRQVETKAVASAAQARTIEPVERTVSRPVTRELMAVQSEQPAEIATAAVSAVEAQARTAEVTMKSGPVTAEPATVTRESVAVAAAAAPAPVEAAAAHEVRHAASQAVSVPVQEAPVQEARVQTPVPEPPARLEAADSRPAEPPVVPREAPAVATVPTRAAPGTQADYGWVADTLRRRVAEVKRYPPNARLNHWEGKVVVHAVIKEDGHLGDLRIHESSGFDVLDEAAMEAVRHACPLSLHHPLGRPRVAIRIPINYTLND